MFRSILTLSPDPTMAEHILHLFRRQRILRESMDLTRQLRSDVAVAADDSGEILITADWPDAEGYQEWLNSPQRARSAPELSALLAGAQIGAGRLYRIDHQVTRSAEPH